jgi:hypothetical protein
MGFAVTADLVDLVASGCKVRYEHEFLDDIGPTHRWALVTFPCGVEVSSSVDDCLSFDCRNRQSPGFRVIELLMDRGVPFTWA